MYLWLSSTSVCWVYFAPTVTSHQRARSLATDALIKATHPGIATRHSRGFELSVVHTREQWRVEAAAEQCMPGGTATLPDNLLLRALELFMLRYVDKEWSSIFVPLRLASLPSCAYTLGVFQLEGARGVFSGVERIVSPDGFLFDKRGHALVRNSRLGDYRRFASFSCLGRTPYSDCEAQQPANAVVSTRVGEKRGEEGCPITPSPIPPHSTSSTSPALSLSLSHSLSFTARLPRITWPPYSRARAALSRG